MTAARESDGMSVRVISLPTRGRLDNPYFELFSASLERQGARLFAIKSKEAMLFRFDVIHVHFPDHYVTERGVAKAIELSAFFAVFFLVAKLLKKKLVWSLHDLEPLKQRHRWLLKPFMALVRALVDGHVFLSESTRDHFFSLHPKAARLPSVLVEHGPYDVTHAQPGELAALRADVLGGHEAAFVVGFLGNIKRYKGIEELERLPTRLPDGRAVHILVAGRADPESGDSVQSVLRRLGPSRATWLDQRLPDALLDRLIRVVDCVLLPYTAGWNSGLAMLVLCNHGRLVGSPLPVFGDVVKRYGAPYAYQYRDTSELPALLAEVAAELPTAEDENALSKKIAEVSFDAGAQKLMGFYRRLRGQA